MTRIFSLEFSDKDFSETTELLSEKLAAPDGGPFHVMTVNAEIAGKILRDPELQEIADGADFLTPDGVGILLAGKVAGGVLTERVTGYDLIWALLRENEHRRIRVFLLGSRESAIQDAAARLQAEFPLVSFAYHHGFFSKNEENEVVERIRAFGPDLLLVGLGFPRQDLFIQRYKRRLGARVVMGVGGSFDVIAGRERRAPVWVQRLGLEWGYRMLSNPSRLHKLVPVAWFGLRVLGAFFRNEDTDIEKNTVERGS
ncbi:glycosyltransferase [Neobacillus piezotolerans]|uniref:Glycosyltransferase n=1 Tax=Neobacillus piezotolerans TaxID=2259171 RepID=A0A3D8GRQ0_9BACI|nr:WecB/TagA/CpsF family glycosyltransferase [Neobacillus piezotolerans]RDU37135.1 glycosyltransferase [Neobacillus piezotolerans]